MAPPKCFYNQIMGKKKKKEFFKYTAPEFHKTGKTCEYLGNTHSKN